MSATEALMWAAERDPILRSTFLNLTFLDRPPDMARFRRRLATAAVHVPRLRQRVVDTEFVDDPDFDLDFHVRHIALPLPGTDRQLLDLAAHLVQDAFDPARPLWQYTVVEGLADGRAALLAKMHHTITDGVGGVRLSAMFVDLEPDAPDPEPEPPTPQAPHDDPGGDNLFGTVGRVATGAADAVRGVVGILAGGPGEAVETARSLARQLLVTEGAHSPLWAGHRSLRRRLEILSVDLAEVKAAAKALGGTVNDVYVAGVAGGAGAYHRAKGVDIGDLRISMPVSTRADKSAGGNAFAPARVLVPAGIEDPRARFDEVCTRLAVTKGERAFALADSFAGALTTLPTPLVVRLARQQIETVDFAAANVRGAPFDLWIAGAHVLSNHPMGPTAGTAFNATLLSYKSSMDIGINIDTAAVDDPGLLRDAIAASLAEVVALARH
jgi:diacylglycerol O-acyltransferase / wax synthase